MLAFLTCHSFSTLRADRLKKKPLLQTQVKHALLYAAVPWLVCAALYTALYRHLPRDRERAKAA
jgi:hypothetical protein